MTPSLPPPRALAGAAVLLALALAPLAFTLAGQPYYTTVATRIVVFGLAALGLNLILGYGNMVSFGHALYMGIGAYAVGIASFHGIENGWLHLGAAIAVAAACAVPIGLVCIRTSGMAFIMITLAFAQSFYFLAVSLRTYGGDEGFSLAARSDFGIVDLRNDLTLYYATFAVLVATMVILHRLVRSRFGMVLRGSRVNEARMVALGYPMRRYKLAAYVISAVICAVAGVLLANLTRFVSPSSMQWIVSGELIIMVVLGGLGTLVGPVLGAALLLVIEEVLTGGAPDTAPVLALLGQHWRAVLGLVIVAVTLTSMRGVLGALRGGPRP